MRIARFTVDGGDPRIGLVEGTSVAEVPTAPDAIAVLNEPDRYPASGPTHALDAVTLLHPYDPNSIFAVGLNYRSHADEVGDVVPTEPMFFMKPNTAATGPGGPVVRPATVRQLDYEAELGLVIGQEGTVAGLVVTDDVSARDFLSDRQFIRMKAPDTFCPFGPWITSIDAVADPYDLAIRLWVDGELRQDSTTKDMVFSFDEILSALGESVRARNGDLILTGTPAGVGLAATPQVWLEPGQTVRVEIEGLGVIEHRVVDA
ncbi:MAG: fumarylacetoacetate hydrolase family protein [Pseudonocardia sp.]|uniref:fumarylacetoacetate hydrolase family protein n=1 Tax=unclassified Pseudonocardia TaxID=2619320 RepID=UPI00086C6546|nr:MULTISPECIES: fumarylacetoacetate hydrolase family protein [unclassified Pseudonocardia]MBN9109355.1 fumarylacetoacetate hydrolase family protein [Pseudonocardia sp.]ODU29507.1 MAG: hypothetical protein ABS80_01755 [Pseudonocardia sp. SCN 72-51]ODV08067.1 MAG: hypothetical protein ABT15_05085 [Pseudonocardia sp. SCN 73-27]